MTTAPPSWTKHLNKYLQIANNPKLILNQKVKTQTTNEQKWVENSFMGSGKS